MLFMRIFMINSIRRLTGFKFLINNNPNWFGN